MNEFDFPMDTRILGDHKVTYNGNGGLGNQAPEKVRTVTVYSSAGDNDAFTKLLLHIDGNFNDSAFGASPPTLFPLLIMQQVNTPDSPHTVDSNVVAFNGDKDRLVIPDHNEKKFVSKRQSSLYCELHATDSSLQLTVCRLPSKT